MRHNNLPANNSSTEGWNTFKYSEFILYFENEKLNSDTFFKKIGLLDDVNFNGTGTPSIRSSYNNLFKSPYKLLYKTK